MAFNCRVIHGLDFHRRGSRACRYGRARRQGFVIGAVDGGAVQRNCTVTAADVSPSRLMVNSPVSDRTSEAFSSAALNCTVNAAEVQVPLRAVFEPKIIRFAQNPDREVRVRVLDQAGELERFRGRFHIDSRRQLNDLNISETPET